MDVEIKRKYSATGLTIIVALLCVMGVAVTTWLVRRHEQTRWEDVFDTACKDISTEIQEELNTRVGKLIALRAFFQSSEEVNINEFETFVYSAESYASDVYALCWAPLIKTENIKKFLTLTKKYGYNNFEIKTQKKPTKYCMPVLFIKPQSVQEKLLGVDILARGAHIQNAITQSYHHGKPIATNLIIIPKVNKIGWVVFIVVYNDSSISNATSLSSIKGVLFSIFYGKDIVETALSAIEAKGINFTIHESEKTSLGNATDIVYLHNSRLKTPAFKQYIFKFPQLSYTQQISVCGRQYKLSFESVPAFFNAYASFESSTVLLCGIVISFLIIFAVWTHSSGRVLVEKLVYERTGELRKSRERLKSAAEFLNNILDSVPLASHRM